MTVTGVCGVGGISANSGLTDNWNATGSGCNTLNPYSLSVPSKCDPAQTITCATQATSNAPTVTYNPGIYRGLTVNAGQNVTLNPGVYIIDGKYGNLSFNGGSVTGSGVTFVLTKTSGNQYASLTWNGNLSINVTAPTSGLFSGVVVYDTHSKKSDRLTINGTSSTYFGGAIVAPGMGVSFTGTGVSGNGHNCTQIVGDTVQFSGNSTVGSDCSTYGTKDIKPATMGATKLLE